MLESDDDLRSIKREIIESRGLIIKTSNLTNALAADIKSIAKRQLAYERKLTWNSAAAYIVFVVVILGALKFAWDARVDAIRQETVQKSSENERLKKELSDTRRREEDRVRSDAKAAAFYELVRQGKRSELVEAYEGLKKEPLTRTEQSMFGDAVERARAELASQLYQHALERVRLLRWQEAATAFEDSLRYRDDASSTSVKLGLAQAYRHLNRQRDAILILAPMSESAPDKDLQDDALFELAYCQQEIQAWNDAKTSWRNFIRRFPDHRQVQEAKNQLAQLAALH